MARRKPRSPDARGDILAAGVRVLRAEGAESLTQTRVAREASVSQGHLTYYFPRKTDLWLAVAHHSLDVLVAELGAFFQSSDWTRSDASTRERVAAVVSFLVRDRERSRLLLTLTLKSRDDAELRKLTLASAERVRALLVTSMPGADPREVDLALATLWGIAIHHLVYEGERPDGYTDALIRDFLRLPPTPE